MKDWKRPMRWFKVAAIAAGMVIAFLVVPSIAAFLLEAAIAALVVAVIGLAIRTAFYGRQISSGKPDSETGEPCYRSPLFRRDTRDVDDELARLKRETGG